MRKTYLEQIYGRENGWIQTEQDEREWSALGSYAETFLYEDEGGES